MLPTNMAYSFGSEQPIVTSNILDFDHVDSNQMAFATYIFKYRSRGRSVANPAFALHLMLYLAALESLMVIPRSPSPVPLEDRDIATLTEAEMRELLQRQRVSSTAM
jgi:hypothetical protein